ncbi:MAG TPA: cysteine desulfurase-like protein [Candidatus Baltobacteraceae bacterium]|nr:cysteine desulfurase-like protein [Candidatus Baltobacteraceae bacterium]
MLSTFSIDAVRAEFPALAIQDNGVPRIYLDNPAGTQVPRAVADAAARCLIETNANLGGFFKTSLAAEEAVSGAHRAMARFVNGSEKEIVIGPSMTSLTFALSRSIGRTLQPGDEIVVTRMDHDGNISPWLTLAEDLGLTVRWLPFNEETWRIEPDALEAVLSNKTKLVALNYASNLTGSINDVRALVRRIHDAGALAYVDAVQFAPHGAVDVQTLDCDFLACSSYKFYGPHLGIVWGREALLERLYPYKVRPQTSEIPYKFETGTPQIELLAALTATVEYIERLETAWQEHERMLAARLIEGLQRFRGVRILGITDCARYEQRVPTVSFVHDKRTPDAIAQSLAERNIFVWSGHNFALEVVRQLGIDESRGVVRIGMGHYNTIGEIESTLEALDEVLNAG